MNRHLTRTLLASVAAIGIAAPAFAAPAADGMPRDLITEGNAYVQTASDEKMATEEERESYLEKAGRQIDETSKDIANSEFGQDVADAWDEVQVQWERLGDATAETWDDARDEFEESWDDFEEEWNEATDEKS